MTTTIRLDASALTALITASGPEFLVELQRAIVAEMARKAVFKDMPDALQTIMPKLAGEVIASMRNNHAMRNELETQVEAAFKKWEGGHGWASRGKHVIPPEMRKLISEAIDDMKSQAVSEAEAQFRVDLKAALDARMAIVMGQVEGYLTKRTNAEVQERVNAAVADRLAAIKSNL